MADRAKKNSTRQKTPARKPRQPAMDRISAQLQQVDDRLAQLMRDSADRDKLRERVGGLIELNRRLIEEKQALGITLETARHRYAMLLKHVPASVRDRHNTAITTARASAVMAFTKGQDDASVAY